MKTFLIIILSIFMLCCLTVCGQAKNDDSLNQPIKISEDGIKYTIVIIEGNKFIATQDAHGYWQLAGPIK